MLSILDDGEHSFGTEIPSEGMRQQKHIYLPFRVEGKKQNFFKVFKILERLK